MCAFMSTRRPNRIFCAVHAHRGVERRGRRERSAIMAIGSCRPADPKELGIVANSTSRATEMFGVMPANQLHRGRNRDAGSTAQDRFSRSISVGLVVIR